MRHKVALGTMAVVLGVIGMAPAWAEPQGKGHGHPQSTEEHATKAAERVTNETIDAVADEVAGTPSGTSKGMPPGLAKKDKMPPGLAKQGKTPPGWDKGRKEGWNQEPKKESLIRRIIHGIFRGKKPAEQKPATAS